MKPNLLNLIVCPYCKKKFQVKVFLQQEKEIIHGLLKCPCREYPIINGVPRILPESFRQELIQNHPKFFRKYKIKNYQVNIKIKKSKIDREKSITSKRFTYEWKKFSQLHGEYEEQFLNWVKVKPGFFRNKIVLDAGCGTGRHIYYAAKYGAQQVLGMDLGESIEVAYHHHQQKENVHLVQADIYHLPLAEKSVDYVYAIGVLHHLPQPRPGFNCLVSKLKKGGHISIWVYGQEGNGLLKVMDPIRKNIISKLPLKMVDLLSLSIILPLYPIFKGYKLINESKNFKALNKVLPQNDFFYYLSKLNLRICHSIFFDQLLAPTAYYYTQKEINSWFKQAGLKPFWITPRNSNSWRGFGVR